MPDTKFATVYLALYFVKIKKALLIFPYHHHRIAKELSGSLIHLGRK